jgi:hypothetical protein
MIQFTAPSRSGTVIVALASFPIAAGVAVLSNSRFSVLRFLSGLLTGIGIGSLFDPLTNDWSSPEGLVIGAIVGIVFVAFGKPGSPNAVETPDVASEEVKQQRRSSSSTANQ